MLNNWMITVPRTLAGDFLREVEDGKREPLTKRFRVPPHIKNVQTGDRMYVVFDGRVRGYMTVLWNYVVDDYAECRTTGRRLSPGRYIGCDISGYVPIENGETMKGFRGIKRA